ncbi:MAG: NADP-dependent oxidoreductase [Saprospiraceae bacterium]|nr:NADP-dependent oxidoreductase [Saprospiraceae bacterium]
MKNKQLILTKRPLGVPDADTWHLNEADVPALEDGEFLVENVFVSIDPTMRGWINDRKSYMPPVALGEVMRAAGTVGKVLQSKHEDFLPGHYVLGSGGIQLYTISNGKGWHRVDPTLAPLHKYLSVLGMTGFTAYFGLLDVGQPKTGETILVSGAAGAVGSIVGQIGKIKGCRMIGIAGGEEKCRKLIETYQYDGAIDYKSQKVSTKIKELCPEGVDIYFDNVGGDILDAALARLNFKGRVVLCGGISQYNATSVKGPANYLSLLANRGRMEGFIVFDFARRYGEAAKQLAEWVAAGDIYSDEQIEKGIENFYPTFLKLFSGEKTGKLILQVNDL